MHFFLLGIKSLLASESASLNSKKKAGSWKLSVKDSVRDDSRQYILKKERENVLLAKIVDSNFQIEKKILHIIGYLGFLLRSHQS